jgi:histidinol-phosphate/aromatic aminotransferase/cobyric acid decarboxylase-like protein
VNHSVVAAGPHGGDAGAVARFLGIDRNALIDLSKSMNPFAPDVGGVLRRHLGAIDDYPDPSIAETALAEAIGGDRGRLVLTNGGSEAIALVARLEQSGSVVEPEFSLYRRHLDTVSDDAPGWRSNPSNPLGVLMDPADAPNVVVWDEAFAPIAMGCWTHPSLVDVACWRLGSLTKLWACPGLRIGYVIAPDTDAADRIRAIQPRWSVNVLAIAVVEPLLAVTDLDAWSRQIATARREFAGAIRALGFDVVETDANWLLVDTVSDLRTVLIRHGVLVRDCTSFSMPSTFRVAIPRPDQMATTVRAFEYAAADIVAP